ncbi:hypothetical protein [Desulfosporosinus sp. FKA]|uniref:hypothetical protein n=1 Tax=Desulfosporosinus sp. FKA TaxID=1969834 RepID=UPI000B49E6BC|nr:hypothetical protein [Desulfosporosinus sp. FKA]
MKRLVFLLALIVLIIMGCFGNSDVFDRYFKGESAHWIGLYQVVGSSSDHVSTDKLIYKGSDPSLVGRVKYSFKFGSDAEGTSGEQVLLKDKGYIMGHGGGNGAVIPKNDTAEVTVEWNGQTEKFSLNPSGPIQI